MKDKESVLGVSRKTGVARSTVYRLLKLFRNGSLSSTQELTRGRSDRAIVGEAAGSLRRFVQRQRAPFTSAHVFQELVQNHPSVNVTSPTLRSHLKKVLRYTYRKITPHPVTVEWEKVETLRGIFTYEVGRLADEDTLFVNLDETSINYRTAIG